MDDQVTIQSVRHIYDIIHQANVEFFFGVWKTKILFSWRWWLLVFFTISPWVLWIVYRKKESTSRLLYAGFVVMILSSWLDFLGVCLGLWYYPVKVLPTIPPFVLYDFVLMPVSIMFFLQIKPSWNPLLKACTYSGVVSFIAEPFFMWLKVYEPIHWEHIYSTPILIAIYLIAHYVSRTNTFERL